MHLAMKRTGVSDGGRWKSSNFRLSLDKRLCSHPCARARRAASGTETLALSVGVRGATYQRAGRCSAVLPS